VLFDILSPNGKLYLMTEPLDNIYYITLLRHGESIGNAHGYHQGQSEFPLTDKGRSQAKALADRWFSEGMEFDKIIASPQPRAKQTAEIIAEMLSNQIEFDPIWMERDNGVYSGLHEDEAKEKFPYPDYVSLYDRIGKIGESEWDLYLRGGQAIQSILRRSPGRYLIVSHGGILNKTLQAIMGIAPQTNFQGIRFRFGNTAFASLVYEPDGHKWNVHCINERSHWQEQGAQPSSGKLQKGKGSKG
jgi:2,3-bisphosphoglycerate-dependent phosphoglycerate mutase